MSLLKRLLLLQFLLMAAACTSMHNIKKDGHNPLGGGYYDDELKPGLHWLEAKSNFAAWPNYDSARKTWKARAEQLCGNSGYQELRVKESVTEPWSADGLHLVTTREGFIVCGDPTPVFRTVLNWNFRHISQDGMTRRACREEIQIH